LATFAVGDKPVDVTSYSDAFLTEYRFQSDGHSYALSRSLRGVVARDLVFIDDRLACVLKKRRYSPWYRGDDASLFWSDRQIWQDPVAKWEWASEPDGLEYLAAMLREACGLEPIRERRDRRDIEQRLWSLTLGLPQEALPPLLGVPDVEYTWAKTATTVNAYHLGSANRFFVGLIDGRVAWIHADYPGLIMQAKLAAQQQAGTQESRRQSAATPLLRRGSNRQVLTFGVCGAGQGCSVLGLKTASDSAR
jgi:hypothetical protein